MEEVLVPAFFGGKICAGIAVRVKDDTGQFYWVKVFLGEDLMETGHTVQVKAMRA